MALLPQPGGEARPGGDWVGQRGGCQGVLRQWEQQEPCPSHFTGSPTPPPLLVWETEEGEAEQDFLFSLGSQVWGLLFGGERAAGRGSHILSPHLDAF